MENKERQILSEIMDLMTSVRSQLELLDAKMAQLQQLVGQGDTDVTPIDLDIDDVDEPVVDLPSDDLLSDDLPSDDLPSDDVTVETESAGADAEAETVMETEKEPDQVEEPDDDLPFFAEPETLVETVSQVAPVEQKAKQAVIDSMTDRQAWRTDMPGTQVRDIRSAISLNDRILFINMLFGQDPMAFQEALTKINQMVSLDEVVEYITAERPEWNLESETVYRFMMAVRRKIR